MRFIRPGGVGAMTRYAFVVHTNPVEGREDEYNHWYSNLHIPLLLQCPGVVSARRLTLAGAQLRDTVQAFSYLAIYEIETDDPQAFVDAVLSRAGTELLPTSSALAPGACAVLWEELK
jgi:hypothetical protein